MKKNHSAVILHRASVHYRVMCLKHLVDLVRTTLVILTVGGYIVSARSRTNDDRQMSVLNQYKELDDLYCIGHMWSNLCFPIVKVNDHLCGTISIPARLMKIVSHLH